MGVTPPEESLPRMDIRDPINQQLEDHIETILRLAEMETPAALVWAEVSLYLHESGTHLRDYVLPKIDTKTPHVNLRGTVMEPKIATYVGATSVEAAEEGAALEDVAPSFLLSNGRK